MSQSFLKDLEEQLVERTEQGVPRSRGRRGLLTVAPALAAAAAVIAVVVLIVSGASPRSGSTTSPRSHRRIIVKTVTVTVTGSNGGPSPKTNPTAPLASTQPSAPAGPVPRGFEPQSFTAISDTTWWLLGQAPCAHAPCTSIVRTDDGGQSFVGIPAPRSSKVSELRFANADDGYAFGYGSALWVTHDAGRRWSPVFLGDEIGDVAASGGYVYVIVRSSNGHGRLLRAPVAGGPWTRLPVPEQAWSGLWVQGEEVILETQSARASVQRLAISDDGGGSFTSDSIPGNIACDIEAPAAGVIWAGCSTGMMSDVVRSADGGGHFTVLGPPQGLPTQPNSAAFGAASADVAVDGWEHLYRTTDGGDRWRLVSGLPTAHDWQYVGFTDPTHGVAIGGFGADSSRLYYTTNAGASYHLVPISGS